jgi:hypothetical protein
LSNKTTGQILVADKESHRIQVLTVTKIYVPSFSANNGPVDAGGTGANWRRGLANSQESHSRSLTMSSFISMLATGGTSEDWASRVTLKSMRTTVLIVADT